MVPVPCSQTRAQHSRISCAIRRCLFLRNFLKNYTANVTIRPELRIPNHRRCKIARFKNLRPYEQLLVTNCSSSRCLAPLFPRTRAPRRQFGLRASFLTLSDFVSLSSRFGLDNVMDHNAQVFSRTQYLWRVMLYSVALGTLPSGPLARSYKACFLPRCRTEVTRLRRSWFQWRTSTPTCAIET
jgi:hypothetical protein